VSRHHILGTETQEATLTHARVNSSHHGGDVALLSTQMTGGDAGADRETGLARQVRSWRYKRSRRL